MKKTSLGGYSGCKILLIEEESGCGGFVRKISSSKDYNIRLIEQKEKQKVFSSEIVRVPSVLDDGYTEDGLYYFDMEYIRGIALSERIKNVEVGKIRNYVNSIFDLSLSMKNVQNEQNATYAFEKKISNLRDSLPYGKDEYITRCIDKLTRHNWDMYNGTFCHGDLTFENIIVKNDELYLIDFLDSFYDCWLLDIATLLQDAECMWAYRRDGFVENNTKIRLMIFKNTLVDRLRDYDERFVDEVEYGLLLKLLRIIPYVNDSNTASFLNANIKRIYHNLEGVE